MRLSSALAIAGFMTAIAAPLAASAVTTYNFSVPVQITGSPQNGNNTYQIVCAVGTTTVPAPTSQTTGAFMYAPYSGTQTFTVQSATPQHTYTCVLFWLIGAGVGWGPVGVQVSGTM